MADAQTLREIAERVEKLTGPSPQIDAEIFAVAVYRRDRLAQHPLRYTASVDAALALVPDGRRILLSEWDHERLRERGAWCCIISGAGVDPLCADLAPRCNHAWSAALALCSCALRALAASQEQRRG